MGYRSLKVIQTGTIESLGHGAVSYSLSIQYYLYSNYGRTVSVAVCEIFSVKEWRDLENQVMGRSRSLKMAPFDKSCTTFYRSAVVNIALSCTVFELFDVHVD